MSLTEIAHCHIGVPLLPYVGRLAVLALTAYESVDLIIGKTPAVSFGSFSHIDYSFLAETLTQVEKTSALWLMERGMQLRLTSVPLLRSPAVRRAWITTLR